jgi:hypothetical protein
MQQNVHTLPESSHRRRQGTDVLSRFEQHRCEEDEANRPLNKPLNCATLPAMAERSFVILRLVGKTPSMAACEACHLNSFVPMELVDDPDGAEEDLRQKYADHTCKPSTAN